MLNDDFNQLESNAKQQNGASDSVPIMQTPSFSAVNKENESPEIHMISNQISHRKKVKRRSNSERNKKSQSPKHKLITNVAKSAALGFYFILLVLSMSKFPKDELLVSLMYNFFSLLFLFFLKYIIDNKANSIFKISPMLFGFHFLLLVFHSLLTIWFLI